MKVYAVAENCYVNGRFDYQDNEPTIEPVVLLYHALFTDKEQAELHIKDLNEQFKDQEVQKGYDNQAFVVIELEIIETIK